MNLMEELPDKSSPEPMVFTKAVANNNIKSSSSMPALGFFDMDFKMMLIIALLLIVILTYMGINILHILGDTVQSGVLIIAPALTSFLDILGNTTGGALNKVSEVTANVATTGIDLADGAVHNVGNLMIGDDTLGKSSVHPPSEPRPDVPENTIQKSVASSKTKWCLAGEYQNKRGCIDLSESDKCMSGEVFPNEEMCILGRPQFQTNEQR
jgi:hypothetical protein